MGSTPADLKRDSEHDPDRDELAELRALLLGQQIVELQALQQRLDDPNVRAEELSQVLARAIAISTKRDRDVQRSFHPIVEQALKISIAKNPDILATSLAPIIGESVRKAVADAFRDIAETINITLENSLSWKSIKWRIEGWRTGKSYADIILLRSQRYKVWQVFLIHHETGLMLQHLEARGGGVDEAELVSSMLTAIQDFARDVAERTIHSSRLKQSEDLEEVKLGKFWIWVHHGPQMLLAATVVGTPPRGLGTVFARENELIHREFAGALATFNGDASAFDGARPHLQNCLLGSTSRPQESSPWWLAVVTAVLLGIVAIGMVVHRYNSHWTLYLARLQREPGIVLIGSEKSWGHYDVSGLRDPLAADPVKLAADFAIDPARVAGHFIPYQSLDQHFSVQRELDSEKQSLEQLLILFPVNSSALQPDQSVRMDWLEEHLDRLQQAAHALGRTIHVTIYGRADPTGPDSKNAALSKQRAERVLAGLRERGIPPQLISAVGLGSSTPIRQGSEAYQLEVNRSVALKVESQQQGDR
jgi:outer membrane protein OmpA-like peptidoglycan-associated protein